MSEPFLLLIETSTEVCSVALSKGEKVLSFRVTKEPKSHARIIAFMVKDVLAEAGLSVSNCNAVVVSEGPGSYTGLRVGVSIAKGICYGASIPLIAVSSLELLAMLVISANNDISQNSIIIPMIDARRMEVYTAKFDHTGKVLSGTEAVILSQDSFQTELEEGEVIFTGDGAVKYKDVTNHPNARFKILDADARGMVKPALSKYRLKEFVDVAYFEPFYLKDFIAGVTKKRVF